MSMGSMSTVSSLKRERGGDEGGMGKRNRSNWFSGLIKDTQWEAELEIAIIKP